MLIWRERWSKGNSLDDQSTPRCSEPGSLSPVSCFTHSISSMAFAAPGRLPRHVSHEGASFTRTCALVTTRKLGEAVGSSLINDGTVVTGSTIDLAVISAINGERTSRVQLLAAPSGQSFRWTSDEHIG